MKKMVKMMMKSSGEHGSGAAARLQASGGGADDARCMRASRAVRTRIDAFDAALWRELDSCTNAPPTCSNAELPDAGCRSARTLNQLSCTVLRSCPGARRSDEYSPE